jgi:lauroyl/myristoyl acyltransferase
MAIRSGAPVVPVFMIRNGIQKHRLLVKDPIELVLTGDMNKDGDQYATPYPCA